MKFIELWLPRICDDSTDLAAWVMWQRSGDRSRNLILMFFTVGKAAGITGVWREIHGCLVIGLFTVVSMLYKTNKNKTNKKQQQTFFLIIAACDHLLLCESVAGSKPLGYHLIHRSHVQMEAPAGAPALCGSQIDLHMLNNFQSNFHTEWIFIQNKNKGPMVCLEGEREKRLFVWLHLELLQREKL